MRAFEFWDTSPDQLDWRARMLQPLGGYMRRQRPGGWPTNQVFDAGFQ